VIDMGLLDKVFGIKKEEEETDSFWEKTEYGFAPRETVSVHFSPDRDAYRGIGSGIIIDATIEEYQRVKALEKKIFNVKQLLVGSCINCNEKFIVSAKQKPIFFKCPFCSTPEEKNLIELLLFQNSDNEIFTNCSGCNKYNYIKVIEKPHYISFHCKSCNFEIMLNKDHPMELNDYSDTSKLNWCSACGHLFEGPLNENYPIICSHCESKLEPKK
jgi:hypothetical protein